MWSPVLIRFSNLFSHSNSEFVFNKSNMDMILGINNDDNGANSNGSGKSTIIEAITLAVTGDVFRKVKKDDFISNKKKFSEVYFLLRNDVLNEDFEISRTVYKSSKSSKLELKINGETPKDIPMSTNGGVDIRIGNKYIYDVLGITQEDFLNYYVIGQGNNNSFFSSNDTKQKEIISRFSNFTAIDELITELELKDNIFEKDKSDVYVKMTSAKDLIEYLEQEKLNIQENFEQTKQEKIEEINNKITAVRTKIKSYSEKLSDNNDKLSKKQKELSEIKDIDVSKKQLELKNLKGDRRTLKDEYDDINKNITTLKSKSGEFITCPKCGEEFIPNDDENIDDINNQIKINDKKLSRKQTEIDNINDKIKDVNSDILKHDEVESKKNTLSDQIESLEEIIEDQKENLALNKTKLKNLKLELDDENKLTYEDLIQPKQEKIEVQEKLIAEYQNEIEDIEKKQSENSFHLFHFGKKGFKTYLANKSIRTIQDICNFYLQKFDTNLQVEISGYKVLKSGDVRDKIEVSVLKNGVDKGLFDKYSGGEKSRIDVSAIIAINKLINNGCGDRGLDLLVFDENISYLDEVGQREIIKILSKSKITTLLVMHQIDDIRYKNKVVIVKENHNSDIHIGQEVDKILFSYLTSKEK